MSTIDEKEVTEDVREKEQREMAEEWSKLSDKEARERTKVLKDKLQELITNSRTNKSYATFQEIEKLKAALYWVKQNKTRSIHFRVFSEGASTRQIRRHPDVRDFKNTRPGGQKREEV